MATVREAPPCVVRILTHHLSENDLNSTQIIRFLCKELNYTKEQSSNVIQQAVADGILIKIKSTTNKAGKTTNIFSLPKNLDSIPVSSHDFYCYECHEPGFELVHCQNCYRSFHNDCYRRNPKKPIYTVPDKVQKNKRPKFSYDTDTEHNEEIVQCPEDSNLPSSNISRTTDSPIQSFRTLKQSIDGKSTIDSVDYQEDSKTDVIFVADVPPLVRQRFRADNYKMEYPQHADVDVSDTIDETKLCTACRLLRTAVLQNPPGLGVEELCYLIDYSFKTYRSWLVTDVEQYMTKSKWSDSVIKLVERILFKCKQIGTKCIAEKIQSKQYTFLIEYLIDLLDMQHNIGVFFGEDSTESESTKLLLNDVQQELEEIRRCSDCYRYSVEKANFWFAKPCVQRHELVYAKAPGYSYWPAKVIRVLRNCDKYDVRFFGKDHQRALVHSCNIKPIDTDESSLKLPKTVKLKEAMQELQYFQALSLYPPSYFGFHADLNLTESIIQNALNAFMSIEQIDLGSTNTIVQSRVTETGAKKRGRPLKRRNINETLPSISQTVSTPMLTRSTHGKRCVTTDNTRLSRCLEITNRFTWEHYQNLVSENQKAKRELAAVKDVIEKQALEIKKLKELEAHNEMEKKQLKRGHWCYWCLKEANIICCFSASYCSRECQTRHFRRHRNVCTKSVAIDTEPTRIEKQLNTIYYV